MSFNLRLKLLTILPKLLNYGFMQFNDLLKEFPEAKSRSAVLILYDQSSKIAFWIGFENGKPTIKETDPKNPQFATNTITMHVDTFIKVLKNELDFRTAYLYDLIEITSSDGLPPTYHMLIWSAFFDKLSNSLR